MEDDLHARPGKAAHRRLVGVVLAVLSGLLLVPVAHSVLFDPTDSLDAAMREQCDPGEPGASAADLVPASRWWSFSVRIEFPCDLNTEDGLCGPVTEPRVARVRRTLFGWQDDSPTRFSTLPCPAAP